MTSDAPVVRCEKLVIGHREPILPPMDVSIRAGRFLAVVGRNGSGKSTWFKTLLGLIRPHGGRIVPSSPSLRTAYVPQVAALDPILPVRAREVVLWGRQHAWSFLRPFHSHADREAAAVAINDAEAGAFADRPYSELSEGQKQRVLFARMLATRAELVLLDEPTAAMDPVAEREAYARLARLAHERGLAVVVISHTLDVAARHADELLWLDREGQNVVHGAPPEVLHHPAFLEQYGEVHLGHGASAGHGGGAHDAA